MNIQDNSPPKITNHLIMDPSENDLEGLCDKESKRMIRAMLKTTQKRKEKKRQEYSSRE